MTSLVGILIAWTSPSADGCYDLSRIPKTCQRFLLDGPYGIPDYKKMEWNCKIYYKCEGEK